MSLPVLDLRHEPVLEEDTDVMIINHGHTLTDVIILLTPLTKWEVRA